MYKFIFFDTETTGLDAEDRLLQLATMYRTDGNALGDDAGAMYETTNNLYNPGRPINPKAGAVHQITEEKIAGAPIFKDSPQAVELRKSVQDSGNIFIAHNAPFDIKMLRREDVNIHQYICTLQVAMHLDIESTIKSYSLQSLRQLYNIEVEAAAHDALGDVVVLEKVFNKLFKLIRELNPTWNDMEIAGEMMVKTRTPILLKRMPFGKHKDVLFKEMPLTYLRWMLKNMSDLSINMQHTIKYYLTHS